MLAAMSRPCPRRPAADRRDLPGGQLRGRPARRELRWAVAAPAHLRLAVQGLRRARPARRLADGARPGAVRATPAGQVQLLDRCGTLDEFLATQALARADQLLAARGALLAEARGIVERWIKAARGRLLAPPGGGGVLLHAARPGHLPPRRIDRFHVRIWRGSGAQIAAGPWFGDSAHVIRIGLGYPPEGELEKGLGIIADALDP